MLDPRLVWSVGVRDGSWGGEYDLAPEDRVEPFVAAVERIVPLRGARGDDDVEAILHCAQIVQRLTLALEAPPWWEFAIVMSDAHNWITRGGRAGAMDALVARVPPEAVPSPGRWYLLQAFTRCALIDPLRMAGFIRVWDGGNPPRPPADLPRLPWAD